MRGDHSISDTWLFKSQANSCFLSFCISSFKAGPGSPATSVKYNLNSQGSDKIIDIIITLMFFYYLKSKKTLKCDHKNCTYRIHSN